MLLEKVEKTGASLTSLRLIDPNSTLSCTRLRPRLCAERLTSTPVTRLCVESPTSTYAPRLFVRLGNRVHLHMAKNTAKTRVRELASCLPSFWRQLGCQPHKTDMAQLSNHTVKLYLVSILQFGRASKGTSPKFFQPSATLRNQFLTSSVYKI